MKAKAAVLEEAANIEFYKKIVLLDSFFDSYSHDF